MYVVYTLLLMLGGVVWLPRLVWRCLGGAGYHHDLRERLGARSVVRAIAPVAKGCIWFHAASVGEAQGIQPIVHALHGRFPGLPVMVSTFTPAGKRMAQRVMPEATTICLLPVDLPWIVRRVVRRVRPRMFIVQETELWPNLFRALARDRIPVVVVNGRLSPRSWARYRWCRPFMRRVFTDVTGGADGKAWGPGGGGEIGVDGPTVTPGYLDDHAFTPVACIEILQARWDESVLEFANEIAGVLLTHFEDPGHGGFFFTADDHEALIQRPRPLMDDALPSGNGIAALALNRLGHLTATTAFTDTARRCLRTAEGSIAQAPEAHCALLLAYDEITHGL
jgi:hypothetical protein